MKKLLCALISAAVSLTSIFFPLTPYQISEAYSDNTSSYNDPSEELEVTFSTYNHLKLTLDNSQLSDIYMTANKPFSELTVSSDNLYYLNTSGYSATARMGTKASSDMPFSVTISVSDGITTVSETFEVFDYRVLFTTQATTAPVTTTTTKATTVPVATTAKETTERTKATTQTHPINTSQAVKPMIVPASLKMKIGDTNKLIAFNFPENVSVQWTSDNTGVAVVSDGTVTAVGAGSATIYAVCGNIIASCVVTVENGINYGDLNNDGFVSASDLVIMQKWLCNCGTIPHPQNADLYSDGTIDLYDFILLRKKVIKSGT